jgi:PTH2 family peptidyl-tRNA hydrolase
MVLLVRRDLKMRIGKIAAQLGHGAISVFFKLVKTHPAIAEAWAASPPAKRIFYCPDEDSMHAIERAAKERGYRTTVMRDEGRTAIAAGSETVLAIAPVPPDRVAEIIPSALKPLA